MQAKIDTCIANLSLAIDALNELSEKLRSCQSLNAQLINENSLLRTHNTMLRQMIAANNPALLIDGDHLHNIARANANERIALLEVKDHAVRFYLHDFSLRHRQDLVEVLRRHGFMPDG